MQHSSATSSTVQTNNVVVSVLLMFGVSLFSYSVFIRREKRERKTLDEIGRRYLTANQTRPGDSKYIGGDKISKGFTADYEHILAPFQDKANVRFMEIGVWYGKSLAMWADWFCQHSPTTSATIIGVDMHLQRFNEHKPELERLGAFQSPNRVQVHEFDTSSKQFESWFRAQTPMDIVLDDGNHTASSQWQLFALIFPLLTPGGIYIIEDIEEPLKFFWDDQFNMSGFPALFATLADRQFLKTKKFRKRWIARVKENTLQKSISVEKTVEALRARVARTSDECEKDRLKKVLQEKESELSSSLLLNDKFSQMDEQDMWEASNEKRRAVELLVKELNRVEIRQQNVIFYKKETL